MLRDPESLPGIMSQLLAGPLGEAIRDGLRAAGVRRKSPTLADVEKVCYKPGARGSPLHRPTHPKGGRPAPQAPVPVDGRGTRLEQLS
ncbi:MAG: hypothetical protein R2789_03340 [Microthrixaceae bacterium]